MTEKLDLRVKLNTETHLLLDAYIEQSGTTKSQVVSDLIWGNLPNRLACARVFLTKYHNNNIYSQGDPIPVKPKARGKTYLPDDFSPDPKIAQDAGLDFEGALEIFKDWAKSRAVKYADWDATFRNACKGWLKEKSPRFKSSPASDLFNVTETHPDDY